MKSRSAPRKIPEILRPTEQVALLEEMSSNGPRRNYIMVVIMLKAGLRVSEVVNLQGSDIDWEDGRITVRQGKGKKDRAVWLKPENLTILKEMDTKGYLFVNSSGERLSIRYVRYMLLAAAERAGITRQISPHLCRHTFATNLLKQTGNLALVSKALGHAHISTTMIYLHIVDEELKNAMQSTK